MHPEPTIEPDASGQRWRRATTIVIVLALGAALFFQRGTVVAAVAELGRLSAVTVALLAGLIVVDRLVRGLMIRRAVGGLTRVEGVVMHDVGAAASYGLPGGGVVGTGLRYHVARTARVDGPSFLAGLTAFGVAISAASWLLPLSVLGLETALGRAGALDLALMTFCVGVLGVSALFWWSVVRSDRLLARVVGVADWVRARAARWRPSLESFDTSRELTDLRERLRAALPGLPVLVAGALLMQLLAASILLVTLYGLGVTGELGILEFARIFFVTRVLSTLAPTPGGVGVVEAGMTAGIASAGVPIAAAGAAVLVFRLATYIVPIVSGAACWFVWRQRPVGEMRRPGAPESASHEVSASCIE